MPTSFSPAALAVNGEQMPRRASGRRRLQGARGAAFIVLLLYFTGGVAAVGFAGEPGNSGGDRLARVVAAGLAQVGVTIRYDPAYVKLIYPGGDVPPDRGVCSDVVIRAWRAVGFDLQQLVHRDMKANFAVYPRHWGLKRPDPNIDHRRVHNLAVYFRRQGLQLPVSSAASDYHPGDLVTWNLPGNLAHIGIVTDRRTPDGVRPLIVHNIGAGAQVEDILFAYPITGHYRGLPAAKFR